jgi:hypothetical protein
MNFTRFFSIRKSLLFAFILLYTFNVSAQTKESKIYCSVLVLFSTSNNSMVLVNESIPSKVNFDGIKRYVNNIDSTTIINFNKSASTKSQLEVSCIPSERMISIETFNEIDFHNEKKWTEFSAQYKREPIIVQVSNIGINDKQDQAIVEIRLRTRLTTNIKFVIMKRIYEEWVFVKFYNPIIEG